MVLISLEIYTTNLFLFLQSTLGRLRVLRVTPSHTFLYKKLDEYGKEHDKDLVNSFKRECTRLKKENEVSDVNKIEVNEDQDAVKIKDVSSKQHNNANQNIKSLSCDVTEDETTVMNTTDFRTMAHGSGPLINKDACAMGPATATTTTATEATSTHKMGNSIEQNSSKLLPFSNSSNNNILIDRGYKHVIDNFNMRKEVADMTEEHQNINENWVTHLVVKNRVSGSHLTDEHCTDGVCDMENGKVVPSKEEHELQHENYVTLVERIITEHITCLQFLQDVVIRHIQHTYSKEMKEPTQSVRCYFLCF